MARIELSNIGGGGTTLSLTTTGTSGASTLAGSVLNIPVYQGQLTLTTTGTSGAATLSGDILNIPQYSGGGTPAGSTGEIQYNNAGAFGASANLAWDNSAVQLNIGAPSAPSGKLNVKGGGSSSSTTTQVWTNSGNTELMRVRDDGNVGIATSAPSARLHIVGSGIGTTNTLLIQNSGGTNLMSVLDNGTVTIPNGNIITNGSTAFAGTMSFRSSLTNLPGVYITFDNNNQNIISTSGTVRAARFTSTFSPTSGSGELIRLAIEGTINQTGGASGTTRGLYVNPTLTSAFDWRSIEWSNNSGYGLYGAGTANNYLAGNTVIGTTTPSARLHARGSNTSSGTNAFLVQNSTPDDIYKIENNGKISYWATNTAAGTTGAQTIDRPSGTVNFGIGASSLVVTNSLCTTSSIVFATVRTNDATATIKNVVPAAGSFTINLGAAATAETSVGFFIIN